MSHRYEVLVSSTTTRNFRDIEITTMNLEMGRIPTYDFPLVGIDPGQVNMGISVIFSGAKTAHQIKLPATVDTVERVVKTLEVVEELLTGYPNTNQGTACVEQAAYAAMYGQVALAENRTSAIIGLLVRGFGRVVAVPPGSIRKDVFGHKEIKGEQVWPEVGKDAASSLCCALYALRLHERVMDGRYGRTDQQLSS